MPVDALDELGVPVLRVRRSRLAPSAPHSSRSLELACCGAHEPAARAGRGRGSPPPAARRCHDDPRRQRLGVETQPVPQLPNRRDGSRGVGQTGASTARRDAGKQHEPRLERRRRAASSQVWPTSGRSSETPATPDSRNRSTGGSAAQQCATTVLSRAAAARTRAPSDVIDVGSPAPRVRCAAPENDGRARRAPTAATARRAAGPTAQPGSRRRTSATCAGQRLDHRLPRGRAPRRGRRAPARRAAAAATPPASTGRTRRPSPGAVPAVQRLGERVEVMIEVRRRAALVDAGT